MSTSLVIVGCGGFGRELFSIVCALNVAGADWTVEGFADDHPSAADLDAVAELGSSVVATVAELAMRTVAFHAVLGIGSAAVRSSIADRLNQTPITYPVLVHPHASVGQRVDLAPGTVIAAGARLSTQITVGRHVHIDQNATVGHDCVIGDFARLNPQACVSGSVVLGRGALVGAHATVLQGLHVGDDAVVGAGAVVVRDVAPNATVKGVPAR